MSVSFDLPYFPRHGLLEDVAKVYASGLKQGVTLFAPRRHGKTAFVKNELIPYAREVLGWRPIYIDLWARRGDPEMALVDLLEEVVEGSQSGLLRRLRLKQIKARAKVPGVSVESTLEPARLANDDALENRLRLALTVLVEASPTLLVLDEVQALAGVQRENFVAALRTVFQAAAGRLWVFYTGSSRAGLNTMFRMQRAPLFESAFSLPLPALGEDFIDDRLAFLAERSSVEVDRAAFMQAFEELGRTPEYVNELVLLLLLANDGDVAAALRAWREDRRRIGASTLVEGQRPLDLAILALLATRDPPPIYSAESLARLAEQIGAPVTTGMIQGSLRKLARAGFIAPTGRTGEYEIEDRALLLQLRDP